MSEGKLPSAMTALRDEDRPVMKWFMTTHTSIRRTLTVAALRDEDRPVSLQPSKINTCL